MEFGRRINVKHDAIMSVFLSLINLSSVHPSDVIIFFKKYTVNTLKRSEQYSYADFMAICGGLLGLFLGVSALSIIEFFYYTTVRLFCTIWTSKNEKSTSKNAIDIVSDNENQKTTAKQDNSRVENICTNCSGIKMKRSNFITHSSFPQEIFFLKNKSTIDGKKVASNST